MFSFQTIGQASFAQWINTKAAQIKERRTINAQACVVVDRWIQKNFEDQGQAVGGWTPLSPVTIALRTRNKTGDIKILQDTGQLKTRWKHTYNDEYAAVQSGVPYARPHNEGAWTTMFGKALVKIPKRQILPDREHIWDKLKKLFSEDLQKKLKLKAE
jgi:phage gpG-like protein